MVSGKVYLVGAGPGHPELLTVKAARLLESCDVVVYDRLIQEEVLAYARPSAERIYMGKAVGRHESRQEEIFHLLARKAGEGKTVVRLKGGDPFLFGRGGEEAEFLADHGVPFEVIPGVSSALAAPLSAGIAVTHRDSASTLAIVTGHEANREESRMNWSALAGIDTVVFLMAVHSVGRIANELMVHGRDPETPAAMIQMAYWHGEKVVSGTLASIGGDVERAGINPPATLVVGDAVLLRQKLLQSHRDLQRRADDAAHFQPAPAPDQLLRLASAGIGSQVLLFALAANLFAHLEEWRTARDLARLLGMNSHGLAETLECLVSLGIIECGPEGYRNLELASRYLLENSSETLRPALLAMAAHVAPATSIGRYVLDGLSTGAPAEFHRLQSEASECLARYAAPRIFERLDLSGAGRMLVAGWGGEEYCTLARERWPDLCLEVHNPFVGSADVDPAAGLPQNGTRYGALLLSGILPGCARNQFGSFLQRAVRLLAAGGTLVLHDSFLAEAPAPPELTLPALKRHVLNGGSRIWPLSRLRSELAALGMEILREEAMPGGMYLVTAQAAPEQTRKQ